MDSRYGRTLPHQPNSGNQIPEEIKGEILIIKNNEWVNTIYSMKNYLDIAKIT